MNFYFSEVDTELNLKEFLLSGVLGVSVIVLPLILKVILSAII